MKEKESERARAREKATPHLIPHILELLHGRLARVSIHPVQRLEVFFKRPADVAEHLLRRVLCHLREVLVDEELAHRLLQMYF